MTPLARNALIVVACLVLIAASVYFALPRRQFPKIVPEDYRRPYVCDACGHTFLEVPAPGVRTCPKCGKDEGVQSVTYVCGKCGTEFEAYRLKDFYGASVPAGVDPRTVAPLPHFKMAGGEWVTSRAQLGPIKCPKCGNEDAATLKMRIYAPKSARRAQED
jgi:DNA-directed RNA polymerase subunit RPC12/RpoP